MSQHQEFEQLSAFVDGELDAAERARVATHVGTCAECRSTLEALRATVAEMRALPDPAPSAQDSWALRAAIAGARRQPTRWQRWAVASSSAAAAAVLIVGGILMATSGRGTGDTAALQEATSESMTLSDYDATSAGALLDDQAMKDRSALPAATTPQGAAAAEDGVGTFEAGDDTGSLAACESSLFENDDTVRTLQRSITASFEGTPAYLLIYEAPDPARLELWAVSQTDCRNVLFFARREL